MTGPISIEPLPRLALSDRACFLKYHTETMKLQLTEFMCRMHLLLETPVSEYTRNSILGSILAVNLIYQQKRPLVCRKI